MSSRHVGNNWVPLVGMSALFLGGAAVDLMSTSNIAAVSAYYAFGTLLLVVVTAIWFFRHPPALLGAWKAYLYTVCAIGAGVLFTSTVAPLNGCGTWLILGGACIYYGVLERARVIVTAGAASVLMALPAAFITAPVWGGALQAIAAAAVVTAGYRLHLTKYGRRTPGRDIELSTLNLL
ncbi:hypothetical protein IV498_06405 [Paenarthrobacter sp. Z7-10]|uniref:hypothetical protein n=1 Tax=Paenarthrobacter sp. Z7-10 TaxID=2787635 RepID=UPI0022A9411E|nr:hypothetical protein [Paenarthrobacter sp. Z7-10]MCZ2402823.1 hypothetical protein [Paenarthrobacter sp. Z7-10]